MEFIKVKTRLVNPPKDDISDIYRSLNLSEGDLVVISSKIVAINQGRCVKTEEKEALIYKEAEKLLATNHHKFFITKKENTIIANAGIDSSNASGYEIMWPLKPQSEAKKIYDFFKKIHNLKNFGVMIVDSTSAPLRRGVMGTCIGFFGFNPLRDYVGQNDLFGRPMEVSKSNIAESIASFVNLLMGEGDEQTPIVIMKGMEELVFSEDDFYSDFIIEESEDLYFPILKNLK